MNIFSLLNSFFNSLREFGLMLISPMYTLMKRLRTPNLKGRTNETVHSLEGMVLSKLASGGHKNDIVIASLPMGEWDYA